MKIETIIHKESNSQIKLPISDDGFSLCPVCGEKSKNKEFRPYDKMGFPSYGICSCGIEYGYECSPDTTEKDWILYRGKWLNEELAFGNSKKMLKSKKIKQLLSIKIEL